MQTATSQAEELAKTHQMAQAAQAASLQNALLQSARPLPFSINNILHQVRNLFVASFPSCPAKLFIHLRMTKNLETHIHHPQMNQITMS